MATSPFAGFAQNWQTKYEIGDSEDELLRIAGGIKTGETDFDEDSDDVSYYDSMGGSESISASQTYPFNFEGHRKYGDAGQEFIRNKMTLQDKSCFFKVTEPDGSVLKGPATVSKITPFGGDANDRSENKFTVTFTGTPEDLKPDGTPRNPKTDETGTPELGA